MCVLQSAEPQAKASDEDPRARNVQDLQDDKLSHVGRPALADANSYVKYVEFV